MNNMKSKKNGKTTQAASVYKGAGHGENNSEEYV
tara:strand:+ start:160 stop:261 length:102 start_codon:yes stop_codon:yes gene_type:complete